MRALMRNREFFYVAFVLYPIPKSLAFSNPGVYLGRKNLGFTCFLHLKNQQFI
jgi:hypothetical protein